MLRGKLHDQALRALGAELADGTADELLAEAAAPIGRFQQEPGDLAGVRCGERR